MLGHKLAVLAMENICSIREVKNLGTNHFKYLVTLQNASGAYLYLSITIATSLVQISSSHT